MTTRSTDSATSSAPARKPRTKAAAPATETATAEAKPRRRTTARASAANQDRIGDSLQQCIAEAAYYRAERRGFQGGSELDDWLEAETEVTRNQAA